MSASAQTARPRFHPSRGHRRAGSRPHVGRYRHPLRTGHRGNTGGRPHRAKRGPSRPRERPMTDVRPSARWIVRTGDCSSSSSLCVFALLAVRAVFDVWMGRRLNDEIARLETQYGPLKWDPVRKLNAWKTWPRRLAPENRARLMDAAAARITLSDVHTNFLYPPMCFDDYGRPGTWDRRRESRRGAVGHPRRSAPAFQLGDHLSRRTFQRPEPDGPAQPLKDPRHRGSQRRGRWPRDDAVADVTARLRPGRPRCARSRWPSWWCTPWNVAREQTKR